MSDSIVTHPEKSLEVIKFTVCIFQAWKVMELETSHGELWKICGLRMGQNIGNSVLFICRKNACMKGDMHRTCLFV